MPVCLARAAPNDAPKPGVSVKGVTNYVGKPMSKVTTILTPLDKDGKPGTPVMETTNEKGEFLFKLVVPGKYKLTAKGETAGSLRDLKELDPVDVEVKGLDPPTLTFEVKLTLK
jgi:hypothetical protein